MRHPQRTSHPVAPLPVPSVVRFAEYSIVTIIVGVTILTLSQFGIMLLTEQAAASAAKKGLREATFRGATGASVSATVERQLDKWERWAGLDAVEVRVNDGLQRGALRLTSNDRVSVRVALQVEGQRFFPLSFGLRLPCVAATCERKTED